MKNISRAISGAGLLIAGAILFSFYTGMPWKMQSIAMILSWIFIAVGVFFVMTSMGESTNKKQ